MVKEFIYTMQERGDTFSIQPFRELVRCKDCKHYKPYDINRPFPCSVGLMECMSDDYCSYGERREDG